MPDHFRTVLRMEGLLDHDMGLEKLGLSIRLSDFLKYYFERFLKNITFDVHAFDHSELEDFEKRYRSQLEAIFTSAKVQLPDILIPIPKGMLGTYVATARTLGEILDQMLAHTLLGDLVSTKNALLNTDLSALPIQSSDKHTYDKATKTLAGLYTTKGLGYVAGSDAFRSQSEVRETHSLILPVVQEYYPQAIQMQAEITELEKAYGSIELTASQKAQLANLLMSLAYRVSVFAVVLDHIQKLEHTYVEALGILRKLS